MKNGKIQTGKFYNTGFLTVSFNNLWEKPLSEPQKHCALYAKGHYEQNDLRDDLRVIYAMNKGGVLTNDKRLFENLVHPTLMKIVGPVQFAEHAGNWLSDTFTSSKLRPDGIFEVYISRIASTQTANFNAKPEWLPEDRSVPFLNDVSPKRIDNDELPPVIPKN